MFQLIVAMLFVKINTANGKSQFTEVSMQFESLFETVGISGKGVFSDSRGVHCQRLPN